MSKFVILGVDGCPGSAFLGTLDALLMARSALSTNVAGEAPFHVVTVSADGGEIIDDCGRSHAVDAPISEIGACDALFIPASRMDEEGGQADLSILAGWVRRQHALGALVCACDTGAFLLGAAGLLDGRRCAAGWRRRDELKRRFPRVEPISTGLVIDDRRVVTSCAPFSWIDAALYAIRSLCGSAAARVAAEATVLEASPTKESASSASASAAGVDPFLLEAERIVRQQVERQLSAQDLARALSTSERTLHRRLKLASGESPKAFIDRVRVDTAKTLLESSPRPLKELSSSAGFTDEASFRRTFRRYTGLAPGAYRTYARARNSHGAHMFAVRKDAEVLPEILTKILDSCINGVTLADPDREDSPIVYANRRFEQITGYAPEEFLGHNCRFLQGDDRDQEERRRIREAMRKREHIDVTLRNYRRNGSMFYNHLNITPLFDEHGKLIYFLGVQYDVSDQVRSEKEISELKNRLEWLNPVNPAPKD